MKKKRIIISLGGSLVVPDAIDTLFLKKFKECITGLMQEGYRPIIVVGGGSTARRYQHAARTIVALQRDDIDWLGIHATRINAHLLRAIFKAHAYRKVVTDPRKQEGAQSKIIIASGWKPGWSTDYVAVRLAETHTVNTIINLSNISYVYSADPKKDPRARSLHTLSWKQFRKLVGNTWIPGANIPFDPIASKRAEKLNLRVLVASGKNLANIKQFLHGKKYKGTLIGG